MPSPILDRILIEIKTAMKSGDKARLLCLRGLHSEIKNVGINQKMELTDEISIDVASRALKQRRESLEQFTKGNRIDLIEQCEKEIAWIEDFLPRQLSEAELKTIVDEAVSSSGAASQKDMGKVMQILMPKVKGKSDGKMVSRLVNEKLASLA